MEKCHVPLNGEEGGWDVIYTDEKGIAIPDAGNVHTIYVEMKNKHNTMNSASASKTFIKMQNQLLNVFPAEAEFIVLCLFFIST